MGLCNLEKIDQRIALRRRLYEYYKENLTGIKCIEFQKIIASKYNYGYMPIRFESVKRRDEIYSLLLKHGIKSRKYFFPLTVNFDYFKESGVNLIEKYQLDTRMILQNESYAFLYTLILGTPVVDKIINVIKKKIRTAH